MTDKQIVFTAVVKFVAAGFSFLVVIFNPFHLQSTDLSLIVGIFLVAAGFLDLFLLRRYKRRSKLVESARKAREETKS